MRWVYSLLIAITLAALAVWLFGIPADFQTKTWQEEVLLHDGRKIIAERWHRYGGSREIGQPPSIKEQSISFSVPGSEQRITWHDPYDRMVRGQNFILIALHILNGTPYVIGVPNLCLSYNKWGRPNPPQVIFRFDGASWQRLPLSELPTEFKKLNLTAMSTKSDERKISGSGPVSAAGIPDSNASLSGPEYKKVLREPLATALINEMCEERVLYKGSWILPNDPIARNFIDQHAK